MSRLGIKNSCKLVDLKKALEENRDKLQDIDDEVYNLIMKTPVFYSKVGSSWRVRYLKEQLGIVIEALNIIVNWINEQSDIAKRENEKWSNLDTDADFDEVLAHLAVLLVR